MTSIRRLLGLFVTIALVAFAAPAMAPVEVVRFTVPTIFGDLEHVSTKSPLSSRMIGSSPPNSLEIDILDANSNNPNLTFDTARKAVTYTGYTGTPLPPAPSSNLPTSIPRPRRTGVSRLSCMSFSRAPEPVQARRDTGTRLCGPVPRARQVYASYSRWRPPQPSKLRTSQRAARISFVNQPANAFVDSSITSKPFNSAGQRCRSMARERIAGRRLRLRQTISLGLLRSLAGATATNGDGVFDAAPHEQLRRSFRVARDGNGDGIDRWIDGPLPLQDR